MSYGYVDQSGKITYYANPLESVAATASNGGYTSANQLGGMFSLFTGKKDAQAMVDNGYQYYGDQWLKPYSGLLESQQFVPAANPLTLINQKYTQAPSSGNVDPLAMYQAFKSGQPQAQIGSAQTPATQVGSGK